MALTRLGPNTVNLTSAVTGTLPVANGGTNLTSGFVNGALTTPAFSAQLSATFNVSDATMTKIPLNTELQDTDDCYDNSSNYRFTPNVAGKYFITTSLQMRCDTSNTVDGVFVEIYKNGAYVAKAAEENQSSRHFGNHLTVSSIVTMNGSSDYVEAYAYIDVSSGQATAAGDKRCNFSGYRLLTT